MEIQQGGNFGFLAARDSHLARLGALAESYFRSDPPAALLKLRLFGEALTKQVVARHGVPSAPSATFDEVLREGKARGIFPQQVADLLFQIKRWGNAAAHEDRGSATDALNALKFASAIGVWYHRTYRNAPSFDPGPFVPPVAPADADAGLREQLAILRKTVAESHDAEAQARLRAQDAEAERERLAASIDEQQRQRAFWENYAAETEAALVKARDELAAVRAKAQAAPTQDMQMLFAAASRAAEKVELDEDATRVLIDAKLRAAGWTVGSDTLTHAAGARPAYGEAMAIAEWPAKKGRVDYALFIDGRCVGVVEAKKRKTDVPGMLGQAKRYAQDIILTPDEYPVGGPWTDGEHRYQLPFMFATNGRAYAKQLATKSGIWFWDARTPGAVPRALPEWFSPRDLEERLAQAILPADAHVAEQELGVAGLRPYQRDAIAAVEDAIRAGRRDMLVAMATGTGKTRLAIALMYELLRANRFHRILFLVDRSALGRQTLDAMSVTDTSGFLKFSDVFNVADLEKKLPEVVDRVQVATVQAMIRRLFDDPDAARPTPGTYDLIIVDEAHRGYTLDAELREEDLGFRNLDDYLSAYRRVLDYFDAATVALTATPALHTTQIFGLPVYRYGYRQAVIDGWLIDHRPPRRITTALSQTGIRFDAGDEVEIVDRQTGEIELMMLPDQVDFEVAEFNRKVLTQPFNRAVAQAVAQECPPDQPGKTLIFAVSNDHADILVDELAKALTEEYGALPGGLVEKITGTVDRPLERIKAFKNDPRPKYVVTVDLLTTGIDVPAITNLVFVRRVNSRILYDQMIGRATRRCDEIGKTHFRIFDAVDLYAHLQDVTDMRPVVVDPALSFATLLGDLARATEEEDRAFVRDQIVVKLRQRLPRLAPSARERIEQLLGSPDALPDRLRDATPADALALFERHPSLVEILDQGQRQRTDPGVFISGHEDELIGVDDVFPDHASPADYIESFEAYVRSQMNVVPALIAATQRPRDLTRAELKEIAVLLDEHGFSESHLRAAYGRVRNADIAAHIIGFVRQAALGDPLVPYATRVESGVERILASRDWTPTQRRWLQRIGRALKEQPVGDPAILSDPLFAQNGGFDAIDREFDHHLRDVLMDLNVAIWDSRGDTDQAA